MMISPGTLTAEQIVRQRAAGDCGIASLATALQRSYADTAALFGILARDGEPAEIAGLYEMEIAWALVNAGVGCVILSSAEAHADLDYGTRRRPTLPPAASLWPRIAGRVAIVTVDQGGGDALDRYHSLAWDGARLWDCNDAREIAPAAVLATLAILLFPLPSNEVKK